MPSLGFGIIFQELVNGSAGHVVFNKPDYNAFCVLQFT